MGWCHEFGPQIVDGCEHPMVAGASTCTCAHCGIVCRGRFAGCADVWARGPRSVIVRVKPTEEPVRRSRQVPVPDIPHHETLPLETTAIELATNGTGGDRSTMVMLDHLWEKVRELEAAIATRTPEATPPNARLEAVSNAVGGLAGGLDRLFAEVRGLQELPARLESLEDELKRRQADRGPRDQSLTETVKRLAGKVGDLEKVRGRVEALEHTSKSATPGPDASAVAKRLEELAARVSAFDEVTGRVTSLEQSKRTSTDRDLATLAGRVTALERAEPPTSGETGGTEALARLERLSSRVAALEQAPGDGPRTGTGGIQADRLASMEKVVGSLVQGLDRVSTQVAHLGEVPKQAAPEGSAGPPPDKVLTSISKRLDRLSTQMSAHKDLPSRVEVAEQRSARADSLAQGLRRAIESIDQLSAQVAALQEARPMATTTAPGAPSPSAPPVPAGPSAPSP